ncbi:hypothetical protein ONZ51_g3685 [Trametes cubensis]|uniref:Oxidase ustYa n=1 Tax=Trametes cubensis TaxID=1111947 RepID=A0AAD7TYA6_9APHY|nr:hypothetical protein ONZ51_g3685 [Trametes cubensis]
MTGPLSKRGWAYCALAAMTLVFALILNHKIYTIATAPRVEWHASDYTYIEDDFPPTLIPLSRLQRDAILTFEDTVHYALNDTAEWESLLPIGSQGFVRLGAEARLFGVSAFHQMHCLLNIQRAIQTRPANDFDAWHVQHCLNYIRQKVLCASSTRLEPVRQIKGMEEEEAMAVADGIGLKHQCRDWSVLRREMEENYRHWPEGMENANG